MLHCHYNYNIIKFPIPPEFSLDNLNLQLSLVKIVISLWGGFLFIFLILFVYIFMCTLQTCHAHNLFAGFQQITWFPMFRLDLTLCTPDTNHAKVFVASYNIDNSWSRSVSKDLVFRRRIFKQLVNNFKKNTTTVEQKQSKSNHQDTFSLCAIKNKWRKVVKLIVKWKYNLFGDVWCDR